MSWWNSLRVIALTGTAMVAGLSITAQAAEPQTMMLSCKGTTTNYQTPGQPEPASTILFLNFKTGTFEGSELPFFNGGKIGQVSELAIQLVYNEIIRDQLDMATGYLDRVTGVLVGNAHTYKGTTIREDHRIGGFSFSLQCRPTQRTF